MPNEHVARIAIISTLLPHLPHRRGQPFRLALIAGAAAVLLLAVFHLFASATVAAVVVLPILYLIYLYEVEVYEDEPWLVIGATMAAGAVLGYAFASLGGAGLSQLTLTADNDTAFVVASIALPIVAQLLMLAGPLFLYLFRSRFREPLDGLTFGAASALGFTLASSLTAFWPSITGSFVGSGSTIEWALRLTRSGLLISLINASTTALVTAALWLHRYDRRRSNRKWQSNLLAAMLVAFGAQIVVATIGFVAQDLPLEVVILAAATIALLLYVRLVIHQALLVEGVEHEIGPDSECPECHRIVPTMAFCPACGVARAASSKQKRIGVSGA
jgi:RsiW-degrading membrane proteinase PrsW (M82 family)